MTAPAALTRPRPRRTPLRPLPLSAVYMGLIAALLCLLPYAARTPWWASALAVLLLAYRTGQALGRIPVLPARAQSLILLLLALAAGWGLYRSFDTLLGRDGGAAMLALLLALKAAETRSGRDVQMLVLLGFFLTVTHFFYAQDTITAVHALLSMVALCAALALWEQPGAFAGLLRGTGAARFAPLLRSAGLLLLQALPLAAALFVLFPRPDSPLWQLPVSGSQPSSGLSDTVNPGGISSLALSDEVAFRAQFDGAVPSPGNLYWRGPVMEFFDGTAWSIGRSTRQLPDVTLRGPVVSYTLTVEPHQRPWVLALDAPASLPDGTFITQNLQVVKPNGIGARSRFKLTAATDYSYGLEADNAWLSRNLQLPDRGNSRTRALAESWKTLSPIDRVRAGLKVFREGGFAYTLNPPMLPSVNGLDTFIFSTKRGFCEHYASAFAFMMRAAGVPARVVTGYQGAEQNGNYLIVRQANAHAWTEVWLAGQGWLRVDPTATVSPERISEGISSLQGAPGLAGPGSGFFKGLSLRLDALQNLWNTWVIGYDGAQQRQLFEKLGLGDFGSFKLTLIGLAALLVAGVPLLLRRRAPVEPLSAAYTLLSRRLKLPRQPQEAASAYGKRAALLYPAQAEMIQTLLNEYQTLRYGPEALPEQVRTFMQRVRAFRPRR